MRLNLGCGHEPLEGWTNVDLYAEEADVKADISQLSGYDADEIRLSHVLEHFSWRETSAVLERLHGCLKPGGRIDVEVPDMNLITREAMKNPDWIRYLYGSQEHEGEYHRTGFTLVSIQTALVDAGFTILEAHVFRSDNPHRYGMPVIQVVGAA